MKHITKLDIEAAGESDDRQSKLLFWAAKISEAHDKSVEAHRKSVEAKIYLGKTLTDAKAALEQYDDWMVEVQKLVPFSLSMAERYMKIAKHRRLTDSANLQILPAALSTLYELSNLTDQQFDQMAAGRHINPDMTCAQAAALLPRITPPSKAKSDPSKAKSEPDPVNDPSFPIMVIGEIDDKFAELTGWIRARNKRGKRSRAEAVEKVWRRARGQVLSVFGKPGRAP